MHASAPAPKVLVIDDSATVCLFMASALEKAGYQVIIATDGRNGLMKALQERPDCLVLDVVLPGVSGFDVCRQLRARDPLRRLPIIMVSVKDTPLDQNWGLGQGADRYLPKPFSEETLVQLVEEVLSERFRPPWTQRIAVVNPPANPPSPPREEPSLTLNKLIPHRSEDANLMSSSNPLSRSVVISDKQARRLYAAIDGQKNVEELCMVIHLDVKQAPKVLQLLLDQQLIHLYGPGRRLTE
jgi:DNA-binding response OmpR family regulator